MPRPDQLAFMSAHIGGICTVCPSFLSFSLQPVPPSLSLAFFCSGTGHLMFNKNANAVLLPYLLIFTNIHVYGSFHQPSPGSFLTPGQMTPGFPAVFCESAESTIVNSRTENLLVAGSNGVIHPWFKPSLSNC